MGAILCCFNILVFLWSTKWNLEVLKNNLIWAGNLSLFLAFTNVVFICILYWQTPDEEDSFFHGLVGSISIILTIFFIVKFFSIDLEKLNYFDFGVLCLVFTTGVYNLFFTFFIWEEWIPNFLEKKKFQNIY